MQNQKHNRLRPNHEPLVRSNNKRKFICTSRNAINCILLCAINSNRTAIACVKSHDGYVIMQSSRSISLIRGGGAGAGHGAGAGGGQHHVLAIFADSAIFCHIFCQSLFCLWSATEKF